MNQAQFRELLEARQIYLRNIYWLSIIWNTVLFAYSIFVNRWLFVLPILNIPLLFGIDGMMRGYHNYLEMQKRFLPFIKYGLISSFVQIMAGVVIGCRFFELDERVQYIIEMDSLISLIFLIMYIKVIRFTNDIIITLEENTYRNEF